MARVPAIKRRRLTPPATDGDDSSPPTLEHEPETSVFFKQASGWNLEQDYESRPRKGRKKDKENTRLPIKTADGLVQQVDDVEGVQDEESDLKWLDAEESEDEVQVEVEDPTVPMRQQILEAKEELAHIALMLNEDPEENVGSS